MGLASVISEVRPEIVFHLAVNGAYKEANNLTSLFQDNVLATANLLRATERLSECRLIYAASSLETGPRSRPIVEMDDGLMAPITPLAITKAASTLLVQEVARHSGRPIVLLTFAIYQPAAPYQLHPDCHPRRIDSQDLAVDREGIP